LQRKLRAMDEDRFQAIWLAVLAGRPLAPRQPDELQICPAGRSTIICVQVAVLCMVLLCVARRGTIISAHMAVVREEMGWEAWKKGCARHGQTRHNKNTRQPWHLGVAVGGLFLRLGGGRLREAGDVVALGLQLSHGLDELWDGGADVGQLDDVGLHTNARVKR